ncbi:(2Fe-2S)-binding protein [Glutamicibacter uratoxydans]|uniref:(2Fe-2S)-binding protein n=1 Tax=Glutamicibacter uratoxydans TaxID=43667 RepID=UPI001FE5ED21|nr:(2Fe-2S)-binding protein [Glutamicibacter uratoxydans]
MKSVENPITISVDDAQLTVEAGTTVAGALIAHGITAWRSTRKNERPRGLFCGIGACFDCLVSIDGQPNQRACMVRVCEGQQVDTETAKERP